MNPSSSPVSPEKVALCNLSFLGLYLRLHPWAKSVRASFKPDSSLERLVFIDSPSPKGEAKESPLPCVDLIDLIL